MKFNTEMNTEAEITQRGCFYGIVFFMIVIAVSIVLTGLHLKKDQVKIIKENSVNFNI